MCITRIKGLLLWLWLSILPFAVEAQTAEQLVKDYVDRLNEWSEIPLLDKEDAFCKLFATNQRNFEDIMIQKFNDGVRMDDPRKYLSLFGDNAANSVELLGSVYKKSSKEVSAKLKISFDSLPPITTFSTFYIVNQKIKGIERTSQSEIDRLLRGETEPTPPIVQNNQTTQPKNNQTQETKENNTSGNDKPPQPNNTLFRFISTPDYASITIDGSYEGHTPLTKALVPGTHIIEVSRWKCKPYYKRMELSSSKPDIHIRLKQLLNRKFEIYIEGNYLMGGMTAYGATVGGFLDNINLEATYYMCLNKSEDIYWCDNKKLPVKSNYTPNLIASAKIGYGIRIGSRFRITPQVGANYFTLKEELEDGKPEIAQGVNSLNMLGSIRFSFAAAKHLKLSITPEYHKNFKTSAGFEVLKETSPIIQDWTEGINVKFGLALFF